MRRVTSKVIGFWWGEGLAYQVPALAFYLLVSLAPLALGLAALGGLIFDDLLTEERISAELGRVLPAELDKDISNLLLRAEEQTGRLFVVYLIVMVWIVSAALGVIERTMNAILGSPAFNIFWGRLRLIVISIAIVALLTVELLITAVGSGPGAELIRLLGGQQPFYASLLPLATTVGTLLLIALIYALVPHREQRPAPRALIEGALPAAIVMQLTPWLVTLYFDFSSLSPGGVFLSLAVIMLSCFVIASGLILGAGITAARSRALRASRRDRDDEA